MNNLTATSTATKAATTARATSIPLTAEPEADDRRGAGGRGAAPPAATGRGAAPGAGVGAAGAVVGADATAKAVGAPGAGATAAGAGILMVGAAVGLGGKLIRTVSFFGCTLAASAGLGGMEPVGVLGVSSAINLFSLTKLKVGSQGVKSLFSRP